MRQVIYQTKIEQVRLNGKLYIVETIKNLDEAIDQICDLMSEDEKKDPFAEDLCPYFGVLWPAAIGLSQFLAEQPDLLEGKSVIELGCGLGLPSMVATGLGANVLATDFHPDVENFFKRNLRHSMISCEYHRLNWRSLEHNQKYDLVIGSDILYESKHPKEVALGLSHFMKDGGKIILSDPGRSYLQKFVDDMHSLGFKSELVPQTANNQEIFVFVFQR